MKVRQLENIVEIEFPDLEKRYMLIFSDKDSASQIKKKIEIDIGGREELDKYLRSLNYKVSLSRDDLSLINEAAVKVPPIYRMAFKTGVDRLIIIS